MNEKLEQVTRTLYEQGVEKGKNRGAEIIEQAKMEADVMLQQATEKAKTLVDEARSEAAQINSAVQIDLRLKTELALAEFSTKLSIRLTDLLLFGENSREVVQKLMCTVVEQLVKEIRNTTHNDLALSLPADWQQLFDQPMRAALESLLATGVAVTFEEGKILPSITVVHTAGAYSIRVDEDALKSFFISHLSERTRKHLGF